ncbi:phosphatase PAP2 family protein [bacterium]|nr:phosphatase PAP2 family protein [bacterium]
MKKLLLHYNTTDLVNSVFFVLLTIAVMIWSEDFPNWHLFAISNILLVVLVGFLAHVAARKGHFWNLLHGYYLLLCVPLAFKELYFLVPAIHPIDYDAALIAIDRALFGVHVTEWTMRLRHPLLTEILQIAYGTYYFLPLILTIDLYRKKRVRAFKHVFLFVMLGFYLSYLGYIAVPGIGPRFTQHEFDRTDEELPGLLVTSFLRDNTNAGESIPPGTTHPAARVQRDVFPSGHTEMTLLVMLIAFRYRARTRWYLLIGGSLLIIATVYLRYHYVIDLIAGGIFAWLTMEMGGYLDYAWTRWREKTAHKLAVKRI